MSGGSLVKVPAFDGLNQQAAEAALKRVGLAVGKVTSTNSQTIPIGEVASSSPTAGTDVAPGTSVDLVFSTGPSTASTARQSPGSTIQTILFTLLGAILLGTIVWALITVPGGLVAFLSKEENARGLITFLIAMTTVGIAVILTLSTIVLETSPENEKRFDRGKQVLTILIGVLGTIVGFYFGSARASEANGLTISTSSLAAGTVNSAYESRLAATGGTPPFRWSVSPALPDGLTLNQETGVLSGTPKAATRTDVTLTVTDKSSPPRAAAKPLTLEIK